MAYTDLYLRSLGMQITEKEKEEGTAIKSNFAGNSAKNIYTSVERSLKQLRTSYLDIVSIASIR